MPCGCDPRVPHLCERHDAERDARERFDRVDLEVEHVSACGFNFEVSVYRSEGPTWQVECPGCGEKVTVKRVEYGSARGSE